MKFAKSACAFAAVLTLACSAAFQPASAQDQNKAQIEALRKAMEKYKDYKVAVRDLYLSTVGCVHYAGEKIPDHMVYALSLIHISEPTRLLSISYAVFC